jgi:hypothetical protein
LIWILHKATSRDQILFFVKGQFLTKKNSKEIWQEVVLMPRPGYGR